MDVVVVTVVIKEEEFLTVQQLAEQIISTITTQAITARIFTSTTIK